MSKIRNYSNKLSNIKKFNYLILILSFVLLSCSIMALVKSRISVENIVFKDPTPLVALNLDSSSWSDLRDTIDYVYIDREKTLTIEIDEGVIGVDYCITNIMLDHENLNELSCSWTPYIDGILINQIGNNIVYLQVTDSAEEVTYVNSDYIVLDGYTVNSLTLGREETSYLDETTYITNKSTVSLNFSYHNLNGSELLDHTHNLKSNIALPIGTKLILIDNINDKVYEHQIVTSTDVYPFTLFKEIGTGTDKPFSESTYYDNGEINEDFTILLDLSNTNISTNYDNVILNIELYDSLGLNVRPTLFDTLKEFNIYSIVNEEPTNAALHLTTDYIGTPILFNSDSTTDINITTGLDYKYINDFKIVDTTYENKEIGLAIKLVDDEDNIIDKNYLKNMLFKLGNDVYYPEQDNIIRINLKNGITDITNVLTITTYENNDDLAEGTYYLKIYNYASYDGYYYDELNDTVLTIPINVIDNTPNIPYSFDVIMDDTNRIITKTEEDLSIAFNILFNGELEEPNIRISLYEKDELTAYNQSYSIIDLEDYISDDLNAYADNIYYVSTNPIQYDGSEETYNVLELHSITNNFQNIAYKLVFELYDGNKKIGKIEKYFIVKEANHEEEN
ncbi:MAG: hypothetical protein WDA21_03405 [Bacilli bacterium]